LELANWLAAQRVTHVATQATGLYWKPIWHILEGRFELADERVAQLSSIRASPEIELSAQRAAG
jgi:transposase